MVTASGELKLPPRLRRGDRVGVFSPAAPSASAFPRRLEQALAGLRRTLGVEPVVAEVEPLGFRAGTAEARARALLDLLASDVKALVASVGGFNSAEILPYLEDAPELRAPPKIVVGYSDCTAVLLGLHALAGWCTFHGPMALTQFGEFPEPHAYTIAAFEATVAGDAADYVVEDPPEWTDEFLHWGGDEWHRRRREYVAPAAREVWRRGTGSGTLYGGNVETLNLLVGTPYLDVPRDIVFFWEVVAQEAYLPRVRRALEHFRQVGLLARTRAMLVGRSPDAIPVDGWALRDVVLEATDTYDFPIVAELPFGHADPIVTLPIGLPATVTAADDDARITIHGPATIAAGNGDGARAPRPVRPARGRNS